MSKPEALRLADLIRSRHGNDINDEAAAELRRLSAVEAQRDALLKALRDLLAEADDVIATCPLTRAAARAAIAKAEGAPE